MVDGAKKSPFLSWIRVSWQHPWGSVTPSLDVHFGKLGVRESSEGCEYFGRNTTRCVRPELLWVCVPFALLQGVKQTGKAAKSLQAEFFHELGSWISPFPPQTLCRGCSWCFLLLTMPQ